MINIRTVVVNIDCLVCGGSGLAMPTSRTAKPLNCHRCAGTGEHSHSVPLEEFLAILKSKGDLSTTEDLSEVKAEMRGSKEPRAGLHEGEH